MDSDEEKLEVQENFNGIGFQTDHIKAQVNKGLNYGKEVDVTLTQLQAEGQAANSHKISKSKKSKKSKKEKKEKKPKKEKKSKKEKKEKKHRK